MMATIERFEKLKRNIHGGIDGLLISEKYPDGIEYTLDPMLGHIEKAEAGEWGDIAPLSEGDLNFIANLELGKTQLAITELYNQKIKAILGDIPQSEIDTWSEQKAQALAWQADSNAIVPFIQNLAVQRGLALNELVERILRKAALYEDLSSKVLGQKHAAEDAAGL